MFNAKRARQCLIKLDNILCMARPTNKNTATLLIEAQLIHTTVEAVILTRVAVVASMASNQLPISQTLSLKHTTQAMTTMNSSVTRRAGVDW